MPFLMRNRMEMRCTIAPTRWAESKSALWRAWEGGTCFHGPWTGTLVPPPGEVDSAIPLEMETANPFSSRNLPNRQPRTPMRKDSGTTSFTVCTVTGEAAQCPKQSLQLPHAHAAVQQVEEAACTFPRSHSGASREWDERRAEQVHALRLPPRGPRSQGGTLGGSTSRI